MPRPIRYTFVFANRRTGVVRRATLSMRAGVLMLVAVLAAPVVLGLGARWSALQEIQTLQTRTATLEIENTSYRAATEQLTMQIQLLQTAVDELGVRSQIDPAAAKAMDKLPKALKERAIGGNTLASLGSATFTNALTAPQQTFVLLRDLLNGLENHLVGVKHDVEQRQELAAATPTIWPTHGWLSAGYGTRADPFSGEPEFHSGLDISADKGRPVYATADATVEFAGRSGNYGNLLVLRHGFGIETKYGHLSRFAAKPGQKVTRGQIIGYVGSTGRATGPHLHYEVTVNGRLLNPLQLLFTKPSA